MHKISKWCFFGIIESPGSKTELRDLTKKFLLKVVHITLSSTSLCILFVWSFIKKHSTLSISQSLKGLENWGAQQPLLPSEFQTSATLASLNKDRGNKEGKDHVRIVHMGTYANVGQTVVYRACPNWFGIDHVVHNWVTTSSSSVDNDEAGFPSISMADNIKFSCFFGFGVWQVPCNCSI